MSSVMVQIRYKGKVQTIRCSIDCKAIVDSILSQSNAHAKTDGWALQTGNVWWLAFVLMFLPRRWLL
eukprot:1437791-Karenia_brevis.AAC.1